MALTDKKYEDFYKTTGTDGDKISSKNLDMIEKTFEAGALHGFHDIIDDPFLGPVVYMVQQMQDELDYLRTEISNNKDKTGITPQQTSAITANEKAVTSHATSITGLTNDMKAVQTNLTVSTDSGIEAKFENLKAGIKTTTIDLKITDNNGKSPKSYKATITLQ